MVNLDYIYEHIVCEFDHYDIPLCGLVRIDDTYKYFDISPRSKWNDPPLYVILDINWTKECEEYLQDTKVAFGHWCYENGKQGSPYKGQSLAWFYEKWNGRDPIEENLI